MTAPVRPTTRRVTTHGSGSRSSKLTFRLDCLFVMAIILIAAVQFSLHSSVHRTISAGVGGNYDDPTASNVKPAVPRINAPNKAEAANYNESSFPTHYTTFSTACSASQNWQSFMFFYFAAKVRQPGHVVRIASGCTEEQRAQLLAFQRTHISKLSDTFAVHFTPDFSRVSGDSYKYYNKPFGLRHWLEHGLKYNDDKDNEDVIVMILDPDMILLRPLTYDFTESNVMIHRSKRGAPRTKKVVHGQPWASLYAFGDGPFRVDLDYVFAENKTSDALKASRDEQKHNYPGGPPYMATGKDMYAIVNAWCSLVPR